MAIHIGRREFITLLAIAGDRIIFTNKEETPCDTSRMALLRST